MHGLERNTWGEPPPPERESEREREKEITYVRLRHSVLLDVYKKLFDESSRGALKQNLLFNLLIEKQKKIFL